MGVQFSRFDCVVHAGRKWELNLVVWIALYMRVVLRISSRSSSICIIPCHKLFLSNRKKFTFGYTIRLLSIYFI
jgi:hypothetical protein